MCGARLRRAWISSGRRRATDVEAFAPYASLPVATLPDDVAEFAPAPRPVMQRGAEPRAAVVLVEIDVQGLVEV